MNLMEATLFTILLTAPPAPFTCRLTDDPKAAICSNDIVIREEADGMLDFGGKYTVKKNRRRDLVFSNGVTGHFDSFGWLQFSNGYAVRRMEGDTFKIALPKGGDLTCRYTVPQKATRCAPG
ncbi:hypothetical protein [Ferrovibrio sp.]|uniref:hypothetical protein n=1 Tax=Ferrovibrio sp. TaxID=1917215 RepID=UPI00311E1A00